MSAQPGRLAAIVAALSDMTCPDSGNFQLAYDVPSLSADDGPDQFVRKETSMLRRVTIILAAVALGGLLSKAQCGAFDDAEEWSGYWRRYERPWGRHYEAPPVLYYGHAPVPEHPVAPPASDPPLYRRIPPTSTGRYVEPYRPQFYGRGRYYGPAIDPYYAPGRVSYGGYRYGWW